MDQIILYTILLIILSSHSVHVSGQNVPCATDADNNYIVMCKNGCNSFNLMTRSGPGYDIGVRDPGLSEGEECRLTLQADPGYGIHLQLLSVFNIGSCGGSCGSGNYLSFADQSRSDCVCDKQKSDYPPGGALFITHKSSLTIHFKGQGEFYFSAKTFGCAESELMTGSKVIPTYDRGADTIHSYTVNLTCPDGYMLAKRLLYLVNECTIEDSGVRNPRGTWSEEPVGCTRIKCDPPAGIANGNYSTYQTSRYRNNQMLTYTCNPGYELEGAPVRTCQGVHDTGFVFTPSGTPQCKKRDCGAPPGDIKAAQLQGSSRGTLFEATRDVRCYTGHTLNGPAIISCQADGTWSTGPKCDIVICGPTPAVDHASVTEIRPVDGEPYAFGAWHEFSCEEGFRLYGLDTVTCQSNGTWSPPPRCAAESCGVARLTDSLNHTCTDCADNQENTVNSTREYTCNEGFLPQTSQIVCTDSGEWTTPTSCKIVTCGEPPLVEHGAWSSSEGSNGDTIDLLCRVGYKLDSDKLLTCSMRGEWENSPKCVPVDCGMPRMVYDIHIPYITHPLNTKYNSELTYACDVGYDLVSDFTTRRCLQTGQWSPAPQCKIKSCDATDSDQIANGSPVPYFSREYGTEVKYVCDAGYMFAGPQTRLCQANGTWSEKPQCVVVDCKKPEDIASAKILYYNSTGLGASVTYMCGIHGLSTVMLKGECGGNGIWSYPDCSKHVKDTMIYIYIGCAGGIILLIFLVLLFVGCCFKRNEKKRVLEIQHTRESTLNRLNDKPSGGRRVDGSHCSNDSGLFIDPDPEADMALIYDDRNGSLLMKSTWKPNGSPPGPYSTNSMSKPRSRHPISNIVLDDLSVQESTYDNDNEDLTNPLYGERRTDRSHLVGENIIQNNLQPQPSSPGSLPSPHLFNFSPQALEPHSPGKKFPHPAQQSPNPAAVGAGRYDTNPSQYRRVEGRELNPSPNPQHDDTKYYGTSSSAKTLPIGGTEQSVYM